MFVVSKNLKIKELSKLFNNEVEAIPLSEALINTLSNNMKFVALSERPAETDIELTLAISIRSIYSNEIHTYENGSLALTTQVFKNPFNPMEGYFLYMYTLQHLLGCNFKYPMKSMDKTVMYPTHLALIEGKLVLIFSLCVEDELLSKFEYKGEGKVLSLKDKDSFTCTTKLDKIILATQKIVTTK